MQQKTAQNIHCKGHGLTGGKETPTLWQCDRLTSAQCGKNSLLVVRGNQPWAAMCSCCQNLLCCSSESAGVLTDKSTQPSVKVYVRYLCWSSEAFHVWGDRQYIAERGWLAGDISFHHKPLHLPPEQPFATSKWDSQVLILTVTMNAYKVRHRIQMFC